MSEEIKEILDRLERIDHKEYSCPFEFADSSSFSEDARCFKERKMLADYTTNLQQKVEQLENIRKEAIEYIKSYKNDYAPYELSDYNVRELLGILNKGSE